MIIKKWNILKEDKEISKILANECGISEFVASILVSRGKTEYESAMKFLSQDIEFSNPFDLKDMKKTIERISKAVDDFEKICIYGDYDCDGVTSTTVLYSYLSSIGADVFYHIPQREGDGYGLSEGSIKTIVDKGATLIITVDNGISAIKEARYAKKLGIDLIITDHHQQGEDLPDAFAIVNPHRKDDVSCFKGICGVGVVFKVIVAMEDCNYESVLEYFGDIIAIGTIADVSPIIDENRSIIQYGLEAIKRTNNVGLLALMKVAKIDVNKIDVRTVAFSIVPRINAAGRMGNSSLGVKLLTTEDYNEALDLANELEILNDKRKNESNLVIDEIDKIIMDISYNSNDRAIILKSDSWNHGVLGIICSRVMEKYQKPVLLMTRNGNEYKGSARSFGNFHLFKMLSSVAGYLTKYGGHKFAAGFSLNEDMFDNFKSEFLKQCEIEHKYMQPQEISIDKVITYNDITIDNVRSMGLLKPYGIQNESPIFMIKNIMIKEVKSLSDGKHQKLILEDEGKIFEGLCFGFNTDDFIYQKGDNIDIVLSLEISTYNENEQITIKIQDIRRVEFSQKQFFLEKNHYEFIKREEYLDEKLLAEIAPTREDIATIYRIIKSNKDNNYNINGLFFSLSKSGANYCKYMLIIDIMLELNLIKIESTMNKLIFVDSKNKVELTDSILFKRLSK